ncbi:MAG: TlpA disulfide reductase family protein [Chitinophagaceae bacterium]
MKHFLYITFFFLFYSCADKNEEARSVRIEGTVTGLPDTKLYLVDAGKWKTPLDSADCINGHFVFQIKTGPSFYPWLAAIHFIRNGDIAHPQRLKFRNPLLGADSLQSLRDAFYVEQGHTTITGVYNASPWLRIDGGRETRLCFKNQFTDIGWMGDKDSVRRKEKFRLLTEEIKQHPWSFFLLQSIYDSKELYQKEELNSLVDLFNDTVRSSEGFRRFRHYLTIRPAAGEPYPVLVLPTPQGEAGPVIDTASGMNMVVFWASWCMPCRKEIPQLKALYRKYAGRNINLVSVSIDTDTGQWQRALRQEQLPWRQYIIPADRIEETENIFGFTTIPLVVFTDTKGKETGRIADYDPGNTARYDSILMRFSHRANR